MMIVKRLVLLLLIGCAIKINAQETFKPQTMLGINGGMSASRINFNPSVKQIPLLGYTGGLVLKHISEPHLGIQLELNFAQKGWEENLNSTNVYRRRCNYIEIPFMSHFELGNKKTKLVLNIGSEVSYLLSNAETIRLNDGYESEEYYNMKIDYKYELGLVLGIGIMQSTSMGTFQFEARFSQSINNIFEDVTIFQYSQNQFANIKLAYLFGVNANSR